ncbi:MAG TPA: DNA translocase FtsK 4TM domain-containing protein, partial [Myxococcota bacterium]|nr:DNA translocase FtsK 4TM domain-containing protein [Myxococcota bacterium]
MARSAARRRRASGRGADSGFGQGIGRWAAESAGLLLIALSALAALALATYTPSDPLFRVTEVANGAGAVGATLAGLLRSAAGWGAAVLVGTAVVVGGRLVVGRGAPGARFWLGACSLLVALATLPPLLAAAGASSVEPAAGGLVGVWLASGERILLSLWGALLVNGLLATGGALSVVGIPMGSALRVAIGTAVRAGAAGAVAARFT